MQPLHFCPKQNLIVTCTATHLQSVNIDGIIRADLPRMNALELVASLATRDTCTPSVFLPESCMKDLKVGNFGSDRLHSAFKNHSNEWRLPQYQKLVFTIYISNVYISNTYISNP